MRILFDQSVHDHRNRGNNSLLEVTRDRFRKFWRDARLDVISISPYFCRAYVEDVHPVDPVHFIERRGRFALIFRLVPRPVWRLIFELRESLKHNRDLHVDSKDTDEELKEMENGSSEAESAQGRERAADQYPDIAQYDMYVPTGGGYMCDSDKRFLFPLFDRLEAAQTKGVLTVMVGQGIGPMEDPELLRRAGEVLPKLDYLLIREEKLTRPLLDALGVSPEKVLMTGDDAIEPAYQARKERLGRGIGLSLRVAAYTDFNRAHINAIRPVILDAAERYNAELVSAPIDSNDADKEYVAELMRGYGRTSLSWRKFESTSAVIRRISRCRVMITGTFHGAVFAISQGIPVIGLANSVEYHNKISGLAAEFGAEGCQVLMLKDETLEENLRQAIEFAWSSAERLRPQLLEAAKRQIEMGHDAYRRIFSLMESKKSH